MPQSQCQFVCCIVIYSLYADGGCTESPQISVQTQLSRPGGVSPPQPIVLSQTYIAVQWQPPSLPNGPNIRYTLTRMKIRQPLASKYQKRS